MIQPSSHRVCTSKLTHQKSGIWSPPTALMLASDMHR